MNYRNLLKPRYLLCRFIYMVYQLFHPNEPWMSQKAVRFLDKKITREQIGIEWGSGRSTLWFGERLKSLISVEHDPCWYSYISKQIQKKEFKNVNYHYIALEHAVKEPTVPYYEKMPAYVKAIEKCEDESIDIAIVDGHYRQACILVSLKKIKKGGLLLVDNTNWLPLEEWCVPPDWLILHRSYNVMSETTIWQKP